MKRKKKTSAAVLAAILMIFVGGFVTAPDLVAQSGPDCAWCDPCDPGEHQIDVDGDPWGPEYFGVHTSCEWDHLCSDHELCTVTEEEQQLVQALPALVEQAHPAAVAKALLALGERVYVNQERGALQVLGCTGASYAAHIPVPRASLEAIQTFVRLGRTADLN